MVLDLASEHVPFDHALDACTPVLRRAEDLGFESVDICEGYPTQALDGTSPSVLLLLAALASRTSLRVGTSVTVGDWMDEALQALKALWSGADGFDGRLVRIQGGVRPLPR